MAGPYQGANDRLGHDTNGRFYLLPMLDMWSDVFASPGSWTTGILGGDFALVPPGWSGTLPIDVARIDAPTPYVWIIGRTKIDGPADYNAAHQVQAGYGITPVSRWGMSPEPVIGTVDPSVDMKTPPKVQVDTMQANKFFTYAAEILKLQPPHVEQPILPRCGVSGSREARASISTKSIQRSKLPSQPRPRPPWKIQTIVRVANGWSMNTEPMGVYGNYYLKRAIVAQVGLGANLPEDAIYPLNDGGGAYVIHFDTDTMLPVDLFGQSRCMTMPGFR